MTTMAFKPPPLSLFTLSLIAATHFLHISWPLSLALFFSLFFLTYKLLPFTLNILNSRTTNLPTLLIPWDAANLLWLIVAPIFSTALSKNLPSFIWSRLRYSIYGWELKYPFEPFPHKSLHDGNEKSVMFVYMDRLELWTHDPEIASQILQRSNDFTIMSGTHKVLSIFGENLFTTSGEEWVRHRRVIAGVINERISRALFEETGRQTEGLMEEVLANEKDGVAESNALFDGVKKITINVLNGVGIGKSVAWEDRAQEMPPKGYRYTFISAAKSVMNGMSGPMLLPGWALSAYPIWAPGGGLMREMANARREYPEHTKRLIDEERRRQGLTKKEDAPKGNVVSMLLKAAEGEGPGARGGHAMSESEMIGNMFIFTAAGFETTANTLTFALVLLVRYPAWQQWLHEEIDTLFPEGADGIAQLDYADVYPKAQRLLCFMSEVLRFYPPVIHISKWAGTAQTITTSKKSYYIPAGTAVHVDNTCLHHDPDTWRNLNLHPEWNERPSDDDEWRFRPSRWFDVEKNNAIMVPAKGTYSPFSGGPRICPGQKMAQVEFVTALALLMRRHRVEAVELEGERSGKDVEERLDRLLASRYPVMTLIVPGLHDVKEGEGLNLRLVVRK